MNKNKLGTFFLFICILICLLLIGISSVNAVLTNVDNSSIVYQPKEIQDIVLNPGKGWILYGYPSDQNIQTLAVSSVGYTRWLWSDIEPNEKEYNWSIIDNFISKWKAVNKKAAFGIMCMSTTNTKTYNTPKWVFDSGARFTTTYSDNIHPAPVIQYVPVWDDSIFLGKLKDFIKALGERYDGNTDIAFIDIRSYGNWGEGHTGGLDRTNNPSSTISDDKLKEHIQIHLDAFHKTRLILPFGENKYNLVYDWAVTKGIGIRRDGLIKYTDGNECLRTMGFSPGVFEFGSTYQNLVKEKIWSANKLRLDVEIGAPSYIGMGQWGSDSQIMLSKEKDLINEMANKMGYHFILKKVIAPQTMKPGKPYTFELDWYNKGVDPIYEPCKVVLGLMDNKKKIKSTFFLSSSNPKTWMPNELSIDKPVVKFSNVPKGTYKLVLGLFQSRLDNKPSYKLGNAGLLENGWYSLMNIIVK